MIQSHGPAANPRDPLHLLEFDRIREILARHTRFELSRRLAERCKPVWSAGEVARLQDETSEARLLLDTAGDVGLRDIPDPLELFRRAGLGGVLNGRELLLASISLDSAHEAAALVRSMASELPLLTAIADGIADFRPETRQIAGSLNESGELLDSASPALGRLRSRVATSYNRLIASLERMASSIDVAPALQSNAIAARGDRLVLEVRTDRREAVPGIVHDVSNTGATVFVEPMGAVDLGNTWRETAAEVSREEARILQRLSALIGERSEEAVASIHALARLDFILARGRMAAAMHAARANPAGDACVRLIDARHPLLGDGAVPASLNIGPGFSVLVVTGPNAGGKTVALKTGGLLALMNQAGMQIPASVDSELAVFSSVTADIGDAQSIDRSVSTFSSHMGAVVEILDDAGPDTLVLLDELGTGTDPEEGAALARAIVGELAERRIPAVVTTHHRVVAEFATETDGVENASMEISPETMLPTYHLAMGLPGRSYAISVARRLGLAQNVLDRAQEMVGSIHVDTEQLLTQLQAEREKLAELSASAERERAAAEKARREIELELVELRRRQDDIAEETRSALRREADELRNTLRRIERDARREGHHEAARQAAEQARRTVRDPNWLRSRVPEPPVREEVLAREAADAEEPQGQPRTVESLDPGDVVELRGLGTRAEVISVSPGDDSVELLIGSATARMAMSEVRRLQGVKVTPVREGRSYELRRDDEPGESERVAARFAEIDIRGRRAHEVHDAVTAFIDRLTLEGASSARIIHGKGTGALRDAVRETLSHHPAVETFFAGGPGEGGDGATVFELR